MIYGAAKSNEGMHSIVYIFNFLIIDITES